jgi:hypothetical protein
MSRDASGNYTLPLAPVVAGTAIEASWANTSLNDVAAALTDSLSRTGDGGMTVAITLIDGTKPSPAFSWTSEATSGFYRAAAGDIRASVLNNDIARFHSSNGLQAYDGATWRDVFYGTVGDAEGQLVTWNNTSNIWEKEANAVIDTSGNFWLG